MIRNLEKTIKEDQIYIDKYMPMHIQSQIDEALYTTVQKKADLLKALTEYEKVKFRTLEERIKNNTS